MTIPAPFYEDDAVTTRRTMYVVREGRADSLGREHFAMWWFDPHNGLVGSRGLDGERVTGQRGQCFFAVPAKHEAKTRRDGWDWVECTDDEARAAVAAAHEAWAVTHPGYATKVGR